MAVRIPHNQIIVAPCATTTQTQTEDGKVHQMGRAVHALALKDGATMKDFGKALTDWLDIAQRLAAGEDIEIVNDKGEVIKTVKPTDDIPGGTEVIENKEKQKRKDEHGNEVEVEVVVGHTINHGTNFPQTMPNEAVEFATVFNNGLKQAISREGNKKLLEEFRKEGRRGRGAQQFDVDKLM